jgi:hypothetical protein
MLFLLPLLRYTAFGHVSEVGEMAFHAVKASDTDKYGKLLAIKQEQFRF